MRSNVVAVVAVRLQGLLVVLVLVLVLVALSTKGHPPRVREWRFGA